MRIGVAAIFRDEASALAEWLHHYTSRGVNGFVLLNDRSQDDWENQIITSARVDVFDVGATPLIPHRQNRIYNEYLRDTASQYDRLLVVDLDEFVWDEQSIDLHQTFEDERWYQIPMTTFGSNGFVEQPPAIVEFFTRREMIRRQASPLMSKWCVVPKEVKHYDFHYPARVGGRATLPFVNGLRLNHYKFQSSQRWEERVVRCGSANATESGAYRHSHDFRVALDPSANKFEDTALLEQNRKHGIVWRSPHYC